ncbi:SDR family oxidoreductase [Streptomyces sp. NPDC058268]|uniref:SDR family oxidoreductase n=1 Tax=Streptomyces sp. NPDC058268 TaxID=3346413 RepID=UPI0036EEF218
MMSVDATILVTGGTGTLGGHVLPLLGQAAPGRRVRVLSRSRRQDTDQVTYVTGDLMTGEGVAEALAGVDTVLHLAGGAKGDDVVAGHLVAAAKEAGVQHLVHISVIGADRMPMAWFATQRAAEEAITGSGIAWTMLRAAQFHDLVHQMVAKMARLPFVPAPGMRLEPVDVRDVAQRLVELTLGEPAGLVAELAGPAVYTMDDVVRSYLDATGRRRPVVGMRMPGKAGRAYREGVNLALPAHAVHGERTWEAFLAERAA